MREILFKAKRLDSGEWVEGYYVRRAMRLVDEHGCLCPTYSHRIYRTDEGRQSFYAVDPETLCQYTGLTDKNGVKIFEGDVVVVYQGWNGEKKCTVLEKKRSVVVENDTVQYGLFGLEKQVSVIGNIHDKED